MNNTITDPAPPVTKSSNQPALAAKSARITRITYLVLLALAFCGFLWIKNGHEDALQYVSAYLLEWSLSIDNIFVFIIIFSFFGVKEENYSRVLLLGILMAIVFRIVFIALGSELVARFDDVVATTNR